MNVDCKVCGKDIPENHSKKLGRPREYCSVECRRQWRISQVSIMHRVKERKEFG